MLPLFTFWGKLFVSIYTFSAVAFRLTPLRCVVANVMAEYDNRRHTHCDNINNFQCGVHFEIPQNGFLKIRKKRMEKEK